MFLKRTYRLSLPNKYFMYIFTYCVRSARVWKPLEDGLHIPSDRSSPLWEGRNVGILLRLLMPVRTLYTIARFAPRHWSPPRACHSHQCAIACLAVSSAVISSYFARCGECTTSISAFINLNNNELIFFPISDSNMYNIFTKPLPAGWAWIDSAQRVAGRWATKSTFTLGFCLIGNVMIFAYFSCHKSQVHTIVVRIKTKNNIISSGQ